MIDYIIVGSGLAGIAFAQQALRHSKSIVVYDNGALQSSRVAGGLYNPVVLKRFNAVWDAAGQLEEMNDFYKSVELELNRTFHFPMPILRKFQSIEEQNNWFAASDKPLLAPYLSTELVTRKYNHIESPFDYGQVQQTGFSDTRLLLESYHRYLSENGLLRTETFAHDELQISEVIQYRSSSAKNIVFAEGVGIQSNPFFSDLPLEGTKGELFTIRATGLDLDCIIKSNVFIVPLGDDLYKVGATYEWNDKTETPTDKGKSTLIVMIKETLDCDFEIISHDAGIRPTVRDRKPLLGSHKLHKNVHVLNGMGTRGVMLAPKMAKLLFEHIEFGKELPPEADIRRFTSQPHSNHNA